jgi:hypothetical protein
MNVLNRKVHFIPPRLRPLHTPGMAARRINAIRYVTQDSTDSLTRGRSDV